MLSFLDTLTQAASLFTASFPIASLLPCSIPPSLQYPSLPFLPMLGQRLMSSRKLFSVHF